jgi:hypothetical protein
MNPEIRYTKNGDVHLAFQVIGTGAFDILNMADYPFAPPLDGWGEQPFLARAVKASLRSRGSSSGIDAVEGCPTVAARRRPSRCTWRMPSR